MCAQIQRLRIKEEDPRVEKKMGAPVLQYCHGAPQPDPSPYWREEKKRWCFLTNPSKSEMLALQQNFTTTPNDDTCSQPKNHSTPNPTLGLLPLSSAPVLSRPTLSLSSLTSSPSSPVSLSSLRLPPPLLPTTDPVYHRLRR